MPSSLPSSVSSRLPLQRLPKAVLFDNDGVVLNSEPIIFAATAQVFGQYGIRLCQQDIQDGIGAGAKYVADPLQKYGLTTLAIEDVMRAREAAFRQIAPGRLKPFHDFHSLADFLKHRRVQMALASSASTEVVLHNLRLAGVDPTIFDHIVDSSKIQRKKPAPDIFLAGAAHFALDPRDCLVIEDAPAGILAAKSANMVVVAVSTSFPRERLTDADLVVESLEELRGEFAAMVGDVMEG